MGRLAVERQAKRGHATVAGMWLAALLGLSAFGVPAAAASGPEFKLCTKAAPAKTGKYSNSSCSEASFVPGGGQKWEREAYPFEKAKKLGFVDGTFGTHFQTIVDPSEASGGPSQPSTVEATVKCLERGKPGGGEITGPKTVQFFDAYTECSVVKETWKCTGGTNKKNHIQTDPLEGTLAYLNAAHTRVGLRVKGLGPGGRLMAYGCPAANLHVAVFGEFLAELTGNVNSANRQTSLLAGEGPLQLQEPMYEEEAFSEEQGKEALEFEHSLERCENGLLPYPGGTKSQEECEPFVGSPPAQGPPVALVAKVSGLSRELLTVNQHLDIHRHGELFLVETS